MPGELWVPPGTRGEEPKKIDQPGEPVEAGKQKGDDVDLKQVDVTPEQQAAIEEINQRFGDDIDLLVGFLSQPDVLEASLEILRDSIGKLAKQCQVADRHNILANFKKNMEDALVKQSVIKAKPPGFTMLDAFTLKESLMVLAAIMQKLPPLNLAVNVEPVPNPNAEQQPQPEENTNPA